MSVSPKRQVAVITGASSGIGKAVAIELATRGWHVVGHGRDPRRSREAEAAIQAAAGEAGRVDFVTGDLSSLAGTTILADRIGAITPQIDVLISNAGGVRDRMVLTDEGLEATYAANHLGPALLTRLLLPALRSCADEAGSARIIGVSSSGHEYCSGFDWSDLQLTQSWASGRAYCSAKLCQLLFLNRLADLLEGSGITVNAMHPGEVASNFTSHAPEEMRAATSDAVRVPPDVPAATIVWMAVAPELREITGRYFHLLAACHTSPLAQDRQLAAKLWQADERLLSQAGVRFPPLD